jgi:hypothetical protein
VLSLWFAGVQRGVPVNLCEFHVARSRRERGLSRGATGLQETMKRKTH